MDMEDYRLDSLIHLIDEKGLESTRRREQNVFIMEFSIVVQHFFIE